ncbi:PREDICTED: G-type lectin S-receptor-like serine/threonine-protein kinase SD2-5 [Nicotiana attenuata]|uniref:Receptor-like serine/threonine-protein kinase n=1 Tax=Nicotiana attenuata TaxID=49451 RepID=A0A314L465_NICAT|nr:PREDICTED: G-type lectin S-receptor-like serine/threonine-protein kinase SD2-5 [Nicotiana attenuata]OIT36400.1 g-type lectin s-receptor-like serinethreonine-protein kinase sd2-5 [Nicotiana attenuata]
MGSWRFFYLVIIFLFFLFVPETCIASVQNIGSLNLGFQGSQMTWIDNDGLILVSNNSNFAFGFNPTKDVTLFLLVVIHVSSSTIVWSANRDTPVRNSDNFMFDETGNAYLKSGGSTIWSTNTAKKGVSVMELKDSGNLVLVGKDGSIIWQSFSHPVDTLLSGQEFTQGMKLVSSPNNNNLSYSLEFKSGDMVISASFQPPQPYWAMGKDNRRTINQVGGDVTSAILDGNSWKIYDQKKVLLWQFIFSDNKDANATWVAALGNDGYITFSILQEGSSAASATRIPQDECSRPASCDPYFVCYSGNKCQCPSALPSCKFGIDSFCNKTKDPVELVDAGDSLGYFALGFVSPAAKTDLNGCKASCLGNCSCAAMFFDSSSGNCFMFDQIGSLQGSANGAGFKSYIKVSASQGNGDNGGGGKGRLPIIIGIVISTTFVILGLIYGSIRYQRRKNKLPDSAKESSEEDNFLEGLSGMPIRFSYRELQNATNNFSIKLGQGGFGSVYQGVLADGSRIAVKKLEGIGQGKKEFRAEVSIIGSIHHLHLVRLRGFCAEGTHRLLAYEYMSNGSLEKWLFKKNKEFMLDWDTRFNIAVGTAKGLAYLHEDCDVKIVHCDIKPENVLLDDHFLAKVSDFGLAKLMTREQSHVFTTMRGTRGYLAPEWITNYAISEKSDVFSYGMVLLEIIGGRKNYDPSESSEKSHFPSYAFKMMEEGKLKDLIDRNLKIEEEDERVSIAIKVALWCIQDDMSLRPSMAKVVQMLEGICTVPSPPTAAQMGSRLFSSFLKSLSGDATSSGTSAPSDCNSDAYLSAVRLSGPR